MRKIERVNAELTFTFNYFEDTIVYKMLRTFNVSTDIYGNIYDGIKSFIEYWVNADGNKYGICLTCDVDINAVPVRRYRFGRNGIIECNGEFT